MEIKLNLGRHGGFSVSRYVLGRAIHEWFHDSAWHA